MIEIGNNELTTEEKQLARKGCCTLSAISVLFELVAWSILIAFAMGCASGAGPFWEMYYEPDRITRSLPIMLLFIVSLGGLSRIRIQSVKELDKLHNITEE